MKRCGETFGLTVCQLHRRPHDCIRVLGSEEQAIATGTRERPARDKIYHWLVMDGSALPEPARRPLSLDLRPRARLTIAMATDKPAPTADRTRLFAWASSAASSPHLRSAGPRPWTGVSRGVGWRGGIPWRAGRLLGELNYRIRASSLTVSNNVLAWDDGTEVRASLIRGARTRSDLRSSPRR